MAKNTQPPRRNSTPVDAGNRPSYTPVTRRWARSICCSAEAAGRCRAAASKREYGLAGTSVAGRGGHSPFAGRSGAAAAAAGTAADPERASESLGRWCIIWSASSVEHGALPANSATGSIRCASATGAAEELGDRPARQHGRKSAAQDWSSAIDAVHAVRTEEAEPRRCRTTASVQSGWSEITRLARSGPAEQVALFDGA